MPVITQHSYVDLRLLTFTIESTTVTLHYFVRTNHISKHDFEVNPTPQFSFFFLLREIDRLIRVENSDWHFDNELRSEQAVRTEVNNVVQSLAGKNDHIYCTSPELKALKSLNILSQRAPHVMLVTPFVVTHLLRHFGHHSKALIFESILLTLLSETSQLRNTLLSLKSIVHQYDKDHGIKHDDKTSVNLLQNLLSNSHSTDVYPPFWAHHFNKDTSSAPVLDLKAFLLLTHAFSNSPKLGQFQNDHLWTPLSFIPGNNPPTNAQAVKMMQPVKVPDTPVACYDYPNVKHKSPWYDLDDIHRLPRVEAMIERVLAKQNKFYDAAVNPNPTNNSAEDGSSQFSQYDPSPTSSPSTEHDQGSGSEGPMDNNDNDNNNNNNNSQNISRRNSQDQAKSSLYLHNIDPKTSFQLYQGNCIRAHEYLRDLHSRQAKGGCATAATGSSSATTKSSTNNNNTNLNIDPNLVPKSDTNVVDRHRNQMIALSRMDTNPDRYAPTKENLKKSMNAHDVGMPDFEIESLTRDMKELSLATHVTTSTEGTTVFFSYETGVPIKFDPTFDGDFGNDNYHHHHYALQFTFKHHGGPCHYRLGAKCGVEGEPAAAIQNQTHIDPNNPQSTALTSSAANTTHNNGSNNNIKNAVTLSGSNGSSSNLLTPMGPQSVIQKLIDQNISRAVSSLLLSSFTFLLHGTGDQLPSPLISLPTPTHFSMVFILLKFLPALELRSSPEWLLKNYPLPLLNYQRGNLHLLTKMKHVIGTSEEYSIAHVNNSVASRGIGKDVKLGSFNINGIEDGNNNGGKDQNELSSPVLSPTSSEHQSHRGRSSSLLGANSIYEKVLLTQTRLLRALFLFPLPRLNYADLREFYLELLLPKKPDEDELCETCKSEFDKYLDKIPDVIRQRWDPAKRLGPLYSVPCCHKKASMGHGCGGGGGGGDHGKDGKFEDGTSTPSPHYFTQDPTPNYSQRPKSTPKSPSTHSPSSNTNNATTTTTTTRNNSEAVCSSPLNDPHRSFRTEVGPDKWTTLDMVDPTFTIHSGLVSFPTMLILALVYLKPANVCPSLRPVLQHSTNFVPTSDFKKDKKEIFANVRFLNAFKWILFSIKFPICFTTTLIEFPQETLNSFYQNGTATPIYITPDYRPVGMYEPKNLDEYQYITSVNRPNGGDVNVNDDDNQGSNIDYGNCSISDVMIKQLRDNDKDCHIVLNPVLKFTETRDRGKKVTDHQRQSNKIKGLFSSPLIEANKSNEQDDSVQVLIEKKANKGFALDQNSQLGPNYLPFPYEVNENTIPLYRSFLYHLSSMPLEHKLRLWRYIGASYPTKANHYIFNEEGIDDEFFTTVESSKSTKRQRRPAAKNDDGDDGDDVVIHVGVNDNNSGSQSSPIDGDNSPNISTLGNENEPAIDVVKKGNGKALVKTTKPRAARNRTTSMPVGDPKADLNSIVQLPSGGDVVGVGIAGGEDVTYRPHIGVDTQPISTMEQLNYTPAQTAYNYFQQMAPGGVCGDGDGNLPNRITGFQFPLPTTTNTNNTNNTLHNLPSNRQNLNFGIGSNPHGFDNLVKQVDENFFSEKQDEDLFGLKDNNIFDTRASIFDHGSIFDNVIFPQDQHEQHGQHGQPTTYCGSSNDNGYYSQNNDVFGQNTTNLERNGSVFFENDSNFVSNLGPNLNQNSFSQFQNDDIQNDFIFPNNFINFNGNNDNLGSDNGPAFLDSTPPLRATLYTLTDSPQLIPMNLCHHVSNMPPSQGQ